MRRSLLAATYVLSLSGSAIAQTTAQPVTPGFISTVGCPSGQTSCFIPYSNANPMPVSGGGGGGGGTVTQGPAGSTPWPVTDAPTEQGVGTPSDTAATVGGNGSTIAQLKQAVAQLSNAVTQLTAIVSNQNATNAGTSATKAQGVQGVTGGVPVAVTWTGQTVGLTGSLPSGTNTIGAVNQAGAWTVGLAAGSNSIGSINNTSFASTIADGADTTLGAKADTAYNGTGSASVVAALKGIYAVGAGPTPAGTNVIGKVTIDQTTPGTTNKVSIGTDGQVAVTSSALPTGAATAANQTNVQSAVGTAATTAVTVQGSATGSAVNVVQQATIASAGGSAGFANAVQGITGGVPQAAAEAGSSLASVGVAPVVTNAGTAAVGKASAGNLYSAYAVNSAATAAYLVCIDATAAPSAGAAITPKDVAYLNNTIGATAQINYGAGPPNVYTTGITCLVTTSLTTYTAGPNDFISVRAR